MLTDLYNFIMAGDALDETRNAALILVRGLIGTRMYPDTLKEGSPMPALVYQLISDVPELTQDGDSGLLSPRVQIDVYSDADTERNKIGKALFTALQGFAGIMGSGSPVTGVPVSPIKFENKGINSFESDRKQYRRTMDMIIFHN